MAEAGNNSGLLTGTAGNAGPGAAGCDGVGGGTAVDVGLHGGAVRRAPLLAELGAGEVRLHGGTSGDQVFFVAWGFVEVLPERVTILAETALHPEEIDPAEAQQELGARAGDCGTRLATIRTSTTRRSADAAWPRRRSRARRASIKNYFQSLDRRASSGWPF